MLVGVLLGATTTPLLGQARTELAVQLGDVAMTPIPPPFEPVATSPALISFLKSAALPGWSQWSLGESRSWAYFAIEGIGLWVYLDRRARGNARRGAYRTLAWDAGRIQLGPRVDGDFDFYERMSNFERSGAFDADPALAGIQPERDGATYNGRIWGLAEGLFLGAGPAVPGAPGYAQALEYYRERAYGQAFLWDWTLDPTSRGRFQRLIGESDDAFRTARTAVGILIANHLVSAIDAFLITRTPLPAARSIIYPTPSLGQAGLTWEMRLGIP